MGVSIIRGGISSGKSELCLSQIEKLHKENLNARCIMMVPDHYSYETERRLVEKFGGTGLNNIDVLTLRRMAINCLSARDLNHLTESGKQMLIYKAVNAACEEVKSTEGMDMSLLAAMQKQGFLDVAASLISEMKRYLTTPEMLIQKSEEVVNNRTLRNKLIVFGTVYSKYCSYIDGLECTDSDDDLYILAERIKDGNEFDSNTYIWVNRFDKFMPQQLCVIRALLDKGVHMTVSICCPIAENESERELYIQTEKTVDTVMRLAEEYGFEGEFSSGKALSHLGDKPDLYKLLRYWTDDFEYKEIPANMSLFQSRDAYGEIERTACQIVDLVRDGGYRYRDIAILCGDENEYRHLVEAVFGEYDIPYFTDRKIILSDHPIAMQILSLIGIIGDDWSYDAVFRYLRAGFIYRRTERGKYTFFNTINQEEIDELENFVLKYGIRGRGKWLSETEWVSENDIMGTAFNDESETEVNEEIEKLRCEITKPIAEFAAAVKGKKTAEEFACALFKYLEDINLYAGLKSDIAVFRKNGEMNRAEQFTKIWNLILDVLNQTVTALGSDKMTLEEFGEYMSVGLSKCEIRTIPSAIDQVYVGSVERSSHANVRAMFIVGAKNGTFPTNIKTEGFLSNKDRNTLNEEYGIELAPDTKKKMDEQYFKVYRAVAAVSEKLYMSYSVQDETGRAQSASHMLLDIHNKFPKMTVEDNLLNDSRNDGIYLSSPKATIHKMLINLSKRHDGIRNPLWGIVREWYEENQEWKRVLSLMDRADYYNRRGIMLDSDIAAILYEGKLTYSASRINTFARCPFEYFLKYGLGAYERDEWDITPANMGSYAHRVINDFCLAVEDGAESNDDKINAWRSLDEVKRNEILGGIIDTACENIMSSNMRDRERTAGILRRMGKTVSDAAILVQKSLSSGNFAEVGMEYEFETDLTDEVAVRGIVDRLDSCIDDGKVYTRVIDYKTGKTEFNIVNIFNGYDMQMVIYALAAKQMFKNSDVSGIYYTAVKSAYRQLTPTVTEDNVREKNLTSLTLDGVTFAPENEKEKARILYNMDNGFFENRESAFTRVKLDKADEVVGVGTFDEINGLMEHVKNTIINIDERTRNGEIQLNPYAPNGNSVCAYCGYSSVCKFDEDRINERVPEGTSEEIWERMKTKGSALKSGVKQSD
jgi:ATP-dependent helicase/nuclease subunit B